MSSDKPGQAAEVAPQSTGQPATGRTKKDRGLVRRLLDRDEAAFTWLIREYHAQMLRLARAFVSSEAVAETEVVTRYLEGQMGLWERIRFQLQVGMCKPCRIYLRQMKDTVRALGRLPDHAIPDKVQSSLLQRFRDW